MPERQGSFLPRPDPDGFAIQNPREPTETQRIAAERALPRSGTQRARVLEAIHVSSDGCTDEEIGTILEYFMSLNTVRPRRGELVTMGWVKDSGRRRKTSSGNPSIVWEYIA